jgi:peptidoglycan-N-acetylglucosamine deacetylase
MQGKSPRLSVIIPAYNEEAYIDKCLDSLMNQDLDKKDFEVIIVNNASTDKTAKIAKKYPITLIYEPKRSVVQARQKGLKESRGQIVVSADADTTYPRKWLSTIEKVFEKNPEIVGVVGWVYFKQSPTFFNFGYAFNQELNLILSKIFGVFPVMFAANFAVRKNKLINIGGYPTHLPELGDQQYILFKLFKEGKVVVRKNIYCFSSSRKHKNLFVNVVIYNGWYRIIGFLINRALGRELIGPAPAIREKEN